jgi:hypothetical protein
MNDLQKSLSSIIDSAKMIQKRHISRVLIVQEQKSFYIGDSCVWFGKLKHVKEFFRNASMDLAFVNSHNHKHIDSLLKNNPSVDNVYMSNWEHISFDEYDLVLLISFNEEGALEFIHNKYGEAIAAGTFRPIIFSLSQLVMAPVEQGRYVFPVCPGLKEFADPLPGELYLSQEEQEWGDEWLHRHGLQHGERLFVLLDSTSRNQKLLKMNVYFEFLSFILNQKNIKCLVFDEQNMGKEEFYSAWLGPRLMQKMIFSKGLKLRQDLCLIGSSHTGMVFGPCTGLMHCASSIFNNYVSNGMPVEEAPLMVVYTGQYIGSELNAQKWWGQSPLVSCLMIKQKINRQELLLLGSLSETKKQLNDSLPCTEFTAEMLINFVNSRLKTRRSVYEEAFA